MTICANIPNYVAHIYKEKEKIENSELTYFKGT